MHIYIYIYIYSSFEGKVFWAIGIAVTATQRGVPIESVKTPT